jgi:hypothetical protein
MQAIECLDLKKLNQKDDFGLDVYAGQLSFKLMESG